MPCAAPHLPPAGQGSLVNAHPRAAACLPTRRVRCQVRLDHMLRRMRVLEEAAAAQAPARVLDDLPLFLGNAVAADSHHVLRYLGISHVLNATEVRGRPLVGARGEGGAGERSTGGEVLRATWASRTCSTPPR